MSIGAQLDCRQGGLPHELFSSDLYWCSPASSVNHSLTLSAVALASHPSEVSVRNPILSESLSLAT